MIDVFGPASLNAVLTRPSDARSFGVAGDTYFKDCTTPSSQDGTDVLAGWLNQVTGSMRSLTRANGLKQNGVDSVVAYDQADDMVLRSLQQLVQRGQLNTGIDQGSANNVVVNLSVTPAELIRGLRVGFMAAAAPTGAATLTLSGFPAAPIVHRGGTACAGGEWAANDWVEVRYTGTAWQLTSLTQSDFLAAAPTKESFGQVRLTYSSPNLILSQCYGSLFFINGIYYPVPVTPISLAPNGNSGLTTYYIYGYWTGATLAIEQSTVPPVVDPIYRHKRKTGDPSRTYVGRARTDAAGAWRPAPNICSYFNPQPRATTAGQQNGSTYAGTGWNQLTSAILVDLVTDDGYAVVVCQLSAGVDNGPVANNIIPPHVAIALDSTTVSSGQVPRVQSDILVGITCVNAYTALSADYHYFTLIGQSQTNYTLRFDNMQMVVLSNG